MPANEEQGKSPGGIWDALVATGAVSRGEVARAEARARKTGLPLRQILIEDTSVSEREVYEHLARQRGLILAGVSELLAAADPELSTSVPLRFLEHHRVFPITRQGETVVVATSDPHLSVPELAYALGAQKVELRLVTPTGFRRLRMAFSLGQVGPQKEEPSESPVVGDLLASGRVDGRLVSLLDAILLDAISERASDIHLEVYGQAVRVRLRMDGELRDIRHYRIPPEQLAGILNVIKVSAGIDISERRVPQSGRFTTAAGGHVFDLRVQTQPSLHGEHAVLRLLPKDTGLLSLEALGLPGELSTAFRRLLQEPSGLVLVVGPTGSGKSTTLYAGLQELARDQSRKVITIEDPVEYSLEDIQQTQARPELGFTFASAVRAFLRQDPDVILVGEIRDEETAQEALRAAQTGHLVLSTLHSNDTVDAIQRLLDLGIHPHTLTGELRAVFSQRLARRICEGCREQVTPEAAVLKEVFPWGAPEGLATFRGRGCARCGGVGTSGRIAVGEYLTLGPALREAITRGLPGDALRAVALQAGLSPLREQALRRVHEGTIALEELRRLLTQEQLAGTPPPPKAGG